MKEFLDNNKKYMEKPVRKSKKVDVKANGEKPIVKKVKKII